jgi:hypothetical protein
MAFSEDRVHRYTLWREWMGGQGYAMIVGLNPSTADETLDDRTIRRCINFAKGWGYGALCMTNLFAYRTRYPKVLKAASDPIGPDNDRWLVEMAREAGVIVAAWGTHGCYLKRDQAVRGLLPALHVLRFTRDGFPEHPLYLPGNLTPVPWVAS